MHPTCHGEVSALLQLLSSFDWNAMECLNLGMSWCLHGASIFAVSIYVKQSCENWFMMIRSKCPAGDICQVELDGFVVGWSKQCSNTLKTWLLRHLAFEVYSTYFDTYLTAWKLENFHHCYFFLLLLAICVGSLQNPAENPAGRTQPCTLAASLLTPTQ